MGYFIPNEHTMAFTHHVYGTTPRARAFDLAVAQKSEELDLNPDRARCLSS